MGADCPRQLEVVERHDEPGTWTVEAIGWDGEVYQTLFRGPDAEQRAREYAAFAYQDGVGA